MRAATASSAHLATPPTHPESSVLGILHIARSRGVVVDDLEERFADASELQEKFVALASPVRRDLLELLEVDDAAAGDLAASAAAHWGITRARASQHLQVLANAGLVQVSPDGTWRYYRRELGAAYPVIEWLRSVQLAR